MITSIKRIKQAGAKRAGRTFIVGAITPSNIKA